MKDSPGGYWKSRVDIFIRIINVKMRKNAKVINLQSPVALVVLVDSLASPTP